MFIDKHEALRTIKDIEYGFCHGACRTGELRTIKYGISSKANPWKLTPKEPPAPAPIEELARYRKIHRFQNGGSSYKLTKAQDKILDAFIRDRKKQL
jgi:hypothetical protein